MLDEFSHISRLIYSKSAGEKEARLVESLTKEVLHWTWKLLPANLASLSWLSGRHGFMVCCMAGRHNLWCAFFFLSYLPHLRHVLCRRPNVSPCHGHMDTLSDSLSLGAVVAHKAWNAGEVPATAALSRQTSGSQEEGPLVCFCFYRAAQPK